jgi:hypothetical protein
VVRLWSALPHAGPGVGVGVYGQLRRASQNAARTPSAPQALGSITLQYQRSRSSGRGWVWAGLPRRSPWPRKCRWISATRATSRPTGSRRCRAGQGAYGANVPGVWWAPGRCAEVWRTGRRRWSKPLISAKGGGRGGVRGDGDGGVGQAASATVVVWSASSTSSP